MAVLKNKTQGNYVNVSKDILKDKSLSLRDRGMLVTILSLPDNWNFTIAGLAKIIPDGKSCIRSSLECLKKAGYLTKVQDRSARGKFGENVIEVHEKPIEPMSDFRITEKPTTDNPITGNPLTENRTQYINKELNTNQGNINQSIPHSCNDEQIEGKKGYSTIREMPNHNPDVPASACDADEVSEYRALIAENIRLNDLYRAAGGMECEEEMVREIYDTICDVVCFPKEYYMIKGQAYPGKIVKSQFLKLKGVHIANLLGRLVNSSREIRNMESYLISTLYEESKSGMLKNQSDLHDEYLSYLRGNPYDAIT